MCEQEAKRRVHEAVGYLLDDGELAISWVLTIDVAGPNDTRYLAHRAGGGVDGADNPMAWTALGMLRASAALAEQQVIASTWGGEDDDEEDE